MADRTIKTTLEISGEGTYRNKLKEIGQALRGVASEQRVLDAEYGKSDASLGKLVQQQALLENKLTLQRQKLEAVRQEYERVVEAEGENSESARKLGIEYNYASAQATDTEKKVEGLCAQIEASMQATEDAVEETKKAETAMLATADATEKSGTAWERFAQRVDGADGKLQKIGNTISKVAGRLNKAMTAATTAFVTYAGKSFMDFEDQMAIVDTIADTAEVSLDKISDDVLAASNRTGKAATELAAATYSAISAGADTAHAVEVVEAAAKGAKAGLSDTETVVDGLTTAMNAWGIAYDKSETVLDKMITTQNVGKVTLGELAANMGKVTAFAPQVGVSLEETLAATAALTKNGYNAESSMTALKNVMSAVIKPTSQAQEKAKKLGLEFNATALRSKGLTAFLAEVQEKTKGDEEALGALFGSVQGLGGVMLLGGGAAQDYADALREIGDSAGALDKAFEARTSSRAEQMSMALNRLKNSAIEFGQVLAPYIDLGAQAIDKLAEKLGSLSAEEQQALLNTAAWTIGLTGMVSVGGKVLANAKSIVTVLGSVGKGFKALTALAGGGGVLLGVAAGVAAIGAGIYGVGYALDQMSARAKVQRAFSGIEVDNEAVDNAKAKAGELRSAMEEVYAAEAKFDADANTFFDDYVAWLTDGLPETKEQVERHKAEFAALVETPYDAIEGAYNTRKANLDALLEEGVISQDLYDKELDQLETETEDARQKVADLETAFGAFTDEAVAQNAALNEDQIAYLGELRDQIQAVTKDILEANNAQIAAAELSEKRVKAGRGSTEDVATATAAVGVRASMAMNRVTEEKESLERQLYVELDGVDDADARAGIERELDELEAGYEAKIAEVKRQATEEYNALAEGVMKQFPELAEQMRAAAEKTHVVEGVYQALAGEITPETAKELAAAMGKGFNPEWVTDYIGDKAVFDQAAAKEMLAGWADEMMAGVADEIEGMDRDQLGQAFTVLSGMIGSGMLDSLDFGDMGEALDALMTNFDLADDGRTFGMELTQGEAQGLQEGTPEVENAAKAHAEAVNTAVREAFGINSPSKVWQGYGKNLMEGLRNGIADNRRLINTALSQLTTLLRNAGRQSVQGWIDGVNSKRSALISAYSSMASRAAAAARERLEIHSPSRVFARIGSLTAEGMIAGLNSRIDAVQTAMRRTVAAPEAGAAARRGTAGGQTVNNYYTVNYTGAISGREARKVSRQLAQVEDARRLGKGAAT